MRNLILGAAIALTAFGAAEARGGHGGGHASSYSSSRSTSTTSDHVVSGYTKANGTYVAPYHATNVNSTKTDNYSTVGNVNPYTGQAGTKPDGPN